MADFAQPIIFAALFWWLSTGLILWLIGLPVRTYKWTALAATVLMLGATIGLLALREQTGLGAAYVGFAAGIVLWAWHEVMFLLGYITGPSKLACPPGLPVWQRFSASARVVLHHELAIAVHAALIIALSWGASNQYAAATFVLLWGMRISAKLVVFSGAPNLVDKFLPMRLDYLKSHFSRRAPTPVFVVAILAVTATAGILAWQAISFAPGSFHSAGCLLLAAIATLAVLEHWALVLPMPDPSLWEWAIKPSRPHRRGKPKTTDWRG